MFLMHLAKFRYALFYFCNLICYACAGVRLRMHSKQWIFFDSVILLLMIG